MKKKNHLVSHKEYHGLGSIDGLFSFILIFLWSTPQNAATLAWLSLFIDPFLLH